MPRLPMTLSRYLGRQFFTQVMIVLAVMAALVFIMDTVELLRRSSGKEAVGFGTVLEMALFRLPLMLQRVLPFAVLIGGLLSLMRLTRTQELIVSRAAGVSAWQFLGPCLLIACAIGVLTVTVLSPLTSVMIARHERLEARYFKGRASMLAVSPSGLWLRQLDELSTGGSKDEYETIVHALRVSPGTMRLQNVIIFTFTKDDSFVRRVDAESAVLHEGYWELEQVLVTAPDRPAERFPRATLPTKLTLNQIQDSFASPETLSFWQLAHFIHVMEEAGFSALRHRLYWHSMMAMPVLLCAMVLIGAAFSLKPHRMGKVGILISAGALTGFVTYFTSDVINALALSGSLPVIAAAWSIPLVALFGGVVAMLHFEDG